MRTLFLVTGPNASGKTTAVERTLHALGDNWGGLFHVILADSRDKSTYFKGSMGGSLDALRDIWRSKTLVLLWEGTDRVARIAQTLSIEEGGRDILVLRTSMTPESMKLAIRGRCERAGRKFNEPYWTSTKLRYEGTKRYQNLTQRILGAKIVPYNMTPPDYPEGFSLSKDLERLLREKLEGASWE